MKSEYGDIKAEKQGKTAREIAKMIDHALLRPELTVDEVIEGCKLATENEVAAVCVRPCDVPLAKKLLNGSDVRVTTVIGFPHGDHATSVKVFEAQEAIKAGAVELDMVINIGRLRSHDFDYVERDVMAVIDCAHKEDVIVKVILENYYLTDDLKRQACRICEKAGADFIKTSTGLAAGGASLSDVCLVREAVASSVRVKAAGGVKNLDFVLALCNAGADRLGTSATRQILEEAREREAARS